MLRIVSCLVIASAVLLLAADRSANAAVGGQSIGGTLQLAPPEGKTVAEVTPVTFGVVFRCGDIPRGKTVTAQLAGAKIPVQLDAKRHYPDGSVKHGVASLLVPKLEEAATLEFSVAEPAEAKSILAEKAAQSLLAGDFEATVSFTFPEGGGQPVVASARTMLQTAGNKATTWLKGPLAIEWLLSGPPVDKAGRADPDLQVQFQVRHYPQTGSTRVSAVVEKCSDGGSDGGLVYDVTFSRSKAEPEVVFEQKNVRHPDLTRFRRVFWIGKEPAEVVVRHDARTMAAAGVIPQYDLSLRVSPKMIDEQWKQWQDPRVKKGLFDSGIIMPYFGATGGRPDIGPLPAWDAYYVYTMDPRQKQIMMTTDELAAGVPIHGRERATGRAISYETRPKLWFADERGGLHHGTEKFRPTPAPRRVKEAVQSVFSPETAHLPGFAYLSYVVSGDYFFLEESYFWAGYVVLSDNPGYSKGTIYSGQLRGSAWGLRTVALTAGIAADDDPEKESLSNRVEHTLRSHLAAMTDPHAHPLGVLPVGNRGDGKWSYAPWQHDYMIMAVDCAAGAGFKDAETLRSLLLVFSTGRFTHAPDFDPQYGCGYWWVFEDSKDKFKATTWKALFDCNKDNAEDLTRLDYPGSYCDLALGASAIGIRTGYRPARQVYEFLKSNAKNITAQRADYPCFAFGTQPIK